MTEAANERNRIAPTATGGNAWRKATGRRAAGVTFTEEEHAAIRDAAAVADESVAKFCQRAALERAKRILAKKRKPS